MHASVSGWQCKLIGDIVTISARTPYTLLKSKTHRQTTAYIQYFCLELSGGAWVRIHKRRHTYCNVLSLPSKLPRLHTCVEYKKNWSGWLIKHKNKLPKPLKTFNEMFVMGWWHTSASQLWHYEPKCTPQTYIRVGHRSSKAAVGLLSGHTCTRLNALCRSLKSQ